MADNMFGGSGKSSETRGKLGIPAPHDTDKSEGGIPVWKWLLFAFFAIYFVISMYRVPLLIKLGEYLIVENQAQDADLIVCLAGQDAERLLAAADVYGQGLAPYIFRARELSPDGFDLIKKRFGDYPSDFDRFKIIMKAFGIPEKKILSTDEEVGSTYEEAQVVRKLALSRGFKRIIIVTSLTHSRRAWLTFTKIFENSDVQIISLPSHYQLFNPKDWWKKRKYLRECFLEYQKLIYYKFAYGI